MVIRASTTKKQGIYEHIFFLWADSYNIISKASLFVESMTSKQTYTCQSNFEHQHKHTYTHTHTHTHTHLHTHTSIYMYV